MYREPIALLESFRTVVYLDSCHIFLLKKGNGKAVLFVYPFRLGYNKEKGENGGIV